MSGEKERKILLLGAGFVSKPTLDYLLRRKENKVLVACRSVDRATKFIGSSACDRAIPLTLDVENEKDLDAQVAAVDLVISLIPYVHHVKVIRSAIRNKVNVVTTSYVSAEMQALDEEAKQAGIIVLNEIGLDPGIDHLYAVKMIDEVHREGGKILSFYSYCGGLPAPENSNNPLGYKFSWSSRGVLLALRNSAKFYKDGKVVEISGPQLMAAAKPYFIFPGFAFVAYPNRDSSPYKERYQIPEAQNIIRGTLRYQGFPQFIHTLVDVGYLNLDAVDYLNPATNSTLAFNQITSKLLGTSGSTSEQDLIQKIDSLHKFDSDESRQAIISGLRWVGVFSDKQVAVKGNPLDTLCAVLEEKCQYEKGERDMVMLQHKFEIELKDGKRETRTSTLIDFGDSKEGGYSSMAKLVGVPCGVAVQQVLDGVITRKGVAAPVDVEINKSLIEELAREGIVCIEETLL